MVKTIAAVASAAVLIAGAGCKKDDKAKKSDGDDKGKTAKTAEPPRPTPPPADNPKLDTAEERVAFYRACYEAVNDKAWDKAGACYLETAQAEMLDSGIPTMRGREEILDKGSKRWAMAFPDLQVTPKVILQNGNRVASIAVMNGTHNGPLVTPMGEILPTDKKVGVYVFHMVELDPAAGGISKEWLAADMGTLLAQLGQSEMPARKAMEAPTEEPTIVMAKGDETEKKNLALYESSLSAHFNKHDIKAIQAAYADDVKFIDTSAPADASEKGALKATGDFFKGFPDVKATVTDKFAAGDYVVAMTVMTGTNKGDMSGMKKTGKPINLNPIEIARFEDGMVKEHWLIYNGMQMMVQLGLVAPPEGE